MTTYNHNVSDRPVQDDFFAKLWAMNWVQKEYNRKLAIEERSAPLLAQIAEANKDAVETFNKLYRASPREQVRTDIASNCMTFSMLLPTKQIVEIEMRKLAMAMIKFDTTRHIMTATFQEIGIEPVVLNLDADENGVVFLRDKSNFVVPDADAASRLMLEKFLMTLAAI
jgi:hypothetical protein